MIKAIGNKRLEISEEEYENYNSLIEFIDKREFVGLFETDINGFITSISVDPSESISMGTIMFINQVMINQRFRMFLSNMNDGFSRLDNLDEKICKNEKNIYKNLKKINNLYEKVAMIESSLNKGEDNENIG